MSDSPPTAKELLDRAKAFARAETVKLLLAAESPPITTLTLASYATALQFPPSMSHAEIGAVHSCGKIYIGALHADIQEAHLSFDPVTGWGEAKHKGFAFLEYDFPESGVMAIEALNGVEFGGRPIKVSRPKDFAAATFELVPKPTPERIFVANVNDSITEEMIKGIFEAFGVIKAVALLPDAISRNHRGCGYIEFTTASSALTATTSIKLQGGLELAGAKLHVMPAMVGGEMMLGMKGLEGIPEVPEAVKIAATKASSGKAFQPLTQQSVVIPVLAPLPLESAAALAIKAAVAAAKAKIAEENSSTLDEGNISINSSKRYDIMQKLMRRESDGSEAAGKRIKLSNPSESADPKSKVIILKNMVSEEDAKDPELESEIRDECTKYGKVDTVHVGSEVRDGAVDITVAFVEVVDAERTLMALNGRFFAGRRITAEFKC
ncbi:Poly(U)-binding-splicing factor puf60 [Chytriomyces hyalinus]|nr:Poly(U)-binding-splicing factor puf60 [Chytriomyces hyalinus]